MGLSTKKQNLKRLLTVLRPFGSLTPNLSRIFALRAHFRFKAEFTLKTILYNYFSEPATANVEVQYTAPAGTKQIHDSKAISSSVLKSTQAALSTAEMKTIVDQAGLKMVQPSVIGADQPS